jgi:hypothetical protein
VFYSFFFLNIPLIFLVKRRRRGTNSNLLVLFLFLVFILPPLVVPIYNYLTMINADVIILINFK